MTSPHSTVRNVRSLVIVLFLVSGATAWGETVVLKNGTVYRGTVDRDNTIVTIYDALRRIVVRDTKVAKFSSESAEKLESFPVVQPLEEKGGVMPRVILSTRATPFDAFGRRSFEFVGETVGKSAKMTQGIVVLGPKTLQIRGIDRYWNNQIPTSEAPKASILAILAKVDRKQKVERLRVGSFLIQAEWYPEALAELEQIGKDFPEPELAKTLASVRAQIQALAARQRLVEIKASGAANQPKRALRLLKTFPTEDVPTEILVDVRDQIRVIDRGNDSNLALADSLREASSALSSEDRERLQTTLVAMLQDLADVPDVVRPRLVPFQSAKPDADAPEGRFALALSGWLVGAEGATDDLASATALLKARDLLQSYLQSGVEERPEILNALGAIQAPLRKGQPASSIPIAMFRDLALLSRPPLRAPIDETPGVPRLMRVRDDLNPTPTEYTILLPPEYHPLRSYPTIIALHGDQSAAATAADRMKTAVDWWSEEAAKRGYIVIAPDYLTADALPDYRYTTGEHSAIELAIRDAKRRFAVDSDRVFLGGQCMGGNAAWDFGLGHPDLFAGIAAVSGLPAKYVWAYRENVKQVPLFVAMGDLAPAESQVVFPFVKQLIARNYDVIFFEHFRRGLEQFPEDAPAIFDWFSSRVRDPNPKQFSVSTARGSDARFYGVVIREFSPGRTVAPESVHPLGKNLKPATLEVKVRNLANLVDVTSTGIRKMEVWLGPNQIDFYRKFEVRINGKAAYKGSAKPDLEAFLEDLRVSGDRRQP
jgi:hypothetical protein